MFNSEPLTISIETVKQPSKRVHQGLITSSDSAISIPVSSETLYSIFPQCIHKERAYNHEHEVIEKEKAELALLTTLLISKRARWLYPYEKDEDILFTNEFSITIKGRRWGRVFDTAYRKNSTLLNAYLFEEALSLEQGIDTLQKSFSYSKNQMPYVQDYLIPTFFTKKLETSPHIPFQDSYGRTLMKVHIEDDYTTFVLTPETIWKGKSRTRTKRIFVPHPSCPLLNLVRLNTQADTPVILTPNLLLTYSNIDSEDYIWTSWYGEERGLELTDFSSLKNHTVYLLIDNTTDSPNLAKHLSSYLADNKIHLKATLSSSKSIISELDSNRFQEIQCEYDELRPKKSNHSKDSPETIDSPFISIAELTSSPSPSFWFKPILLKNSVVLLYAAAGTGKTWFALSAALASANGKNIFYGWTNKEKTHVFYCDGEMGKNKIGKRIELLEKLYGSKGRTHFHYYKQTDQIDISSEYWQKNFEKNIHATTNGNESIVVFDNWSTLCSLPGSDVNWKKAFDWFASLKEKKVTTLIIHHPNKKGEQRGSALKEANVDAILKLESLSSTSICFKIIFEKLRDVGLGVKNFSATLHTSPKPHWEIDTYTYSELPRHKQIIKLFSDGKTRKEIREALGCSRSTVYRALNKES